MKPYTETIYIETIYFNFIHRKMIFITTEYADFSMNALEIDVPNAKLVFELN